MTPKTEDGWVLDDSLDFTDDQMAEIRRLIDAGKVEEAMKLAESIILEKDQASNE